MNVIFHFYAEWILNKKCLCSLWPVFGYSESPNVQVQSSNSSWKVAIANVINNLKNFVNLPRYDCENISTESRHQELKISWSNELMECNCKWKRAWDAWQFCRWLAPSCWWLFLGMLLAVILPNISRSSCSSCWPKLGRFRCCWTKVSEQQISEITREQSLCPQLLTSYRIRLSSQCDFDVSQGLWQLYQPINCTKLAQQKTFWRTDWEWFSRNPKAELESTLFVLLSDLVKHNC